ncbi:response regulator [Chondrinema litorale]|uniref:response regulator n=1 Tax=Chondrinema litorale TaxID=2994555 RepID=UPI002542AA5B|nr:response regulator [Chondrinema litorale]UZR99915.1 response regulator [Chondrinema litorale]
MQLFSHVWSFFLYIYALKVRIMILIIEDDEIDVLINERMINKYQGNIKRVIAKNGSEADNILNELAASGNFPEKIILDLIMPIMDGFQFLDMYASKFYPKYPETKIYVLTSSIHPADSKRTNMYPFVGGHVIKPLSAAGIKEIFD